MYLSSGNLPCDIIEASIHKKRYTFCLLTGFNPSAIKNMAQGSVFRGHYSNQFDCNDPQVLALALFIFHLADLLEPLYQTFGLFLITAINASI